MRPVNESQPSQNNQFPQQLFILKGPKLGRYLYLLDFLVGGYWSLRVSLMPEP